MCICLDCNGSDSQHEVEFPSPRYEIRNGKKVKICDGFVAYKKTEIQKKQVPYVPLATK